LLPLRNQIAGLLLAIMARTSPRVSRSACCEAVELEKGFPESHIGQFHRLERSTARLSPDTRVKYGKAEMIWIKRT